MKKYQELYRKFPINLIDIFLWNSSQSGIKHKDFSRCKKRVIGIELRTVAHTLTHYINLINHTEIIGRKKSSFQVQIHNTKIKVMVHAID